MTEQIDTLDVKALNQLFLELSKEHRVQVRRGKSADQVAEIRYQMDYVYSLLCKKRFMYLSELSNGRDVETPFNKK